MSKGFLVCNRIRDYPRLMAATVRGRCARCDAEIWVSPSSFELMIEKDLETLCFLCAAPDMIKSEAEITGLDPVQAKELKEYGLDPSVLTKDPAALRKLFFKEVKKRKNEK